MNPLITADNILSIVFARDGIVRTVNFGSFPFPPFKDPLPGVYVLFGDGLTPPIIGFAAIHYSEWPSYFDLLLARAIVAGGSINVGGTPGATNQLNYEIYISF